MKDSGASLSVESGPSAAAQTEHGEDVTTLETSTPLRPGSHYSENHDDGDGNVYGNGKNAVNWSHSNFVQLTKKKDIYPVVVDLPFVAVSALHSPWTSQESSLQHFIRCSSPAGLAQEPSCTISLAVQLRVAFRPIPGTSVLYSCSTPFLGSTKGAGYMGERCVPPLENYGEEVS